MSQPWIHSARFDLGLIIAPMFVAAALAVFLPQADTLPIWVFPLCVVALDVGHVWSTLLRTYLDPMMRHERGGLLVSVPLMVWLVGILLYKYSAALFWTLLAYLAVFHFVRQQYGFLRIYGRCETHGIWTSVETACLYLAVLHPLFSWHISLPKNFHWFVEGDFLSGAPENLALVSGWVLSGLCVVCLSRLIFQLVFGLAWNLPKILLLAGTAISWHVSMVGHDSDLRFTLANVIPHAIPYFALVWVTARREGRSLPPRVFAAWWGWIVFMILAVATAYVEEGLWDALIWRDNPWIFGCFQWLPQISHASTLAWIVPLLALPQATHYILDGFIWKMRRGGFEHG